MSAASAGNRRLGMTWLLAGGRFDGLLAGLLAALSVVMGSYHHAGWVAVLDVVAAALAALTARWPTIAGAALGLLLIGYLLLPEGTRTMGEYAPLISILGAGMRGQRSQRAWTSAGYGCVLVALTWQDYPGSVLFVLGVLVWAVLIAVLWLIGDLFTAHRRAEVDAAAMAVIQERLVLARELHDTTARTLARVLFAGERSTSNGEVGPAIEQLMIGVRQAADELRQSLIMLRSAEPFASPDRTDPLIVASAEAQRALDEAGFPTVVSIDGDLARIPRPARMSLAAALGEAVANVERHGLSGQPCAISLWADSTEVGLMVSNEIRINDGKGEADDRERVELGLLGVAEQVSALGGDLDAEREGSTWLMRVTIPMG